MKGKTKKFIDKKNSVTFYLAHRSQKDPLIVDETAPQHVLVPVNQGGDNGVTGSGVNNENVSSEVILITLFTK